MKIGKWFSEHNITAPAILLFTALLAQAPHAAFVFNRVSQHSAEWEVWAGALGALVYAIALEGATAYFVWKNNMWWAVGFAAFSIAHNIAYYMPATWTFTAWGAELTVRDTFSAILISVSLPVAIAAFSHVQAQARHDKTVTTETKDETSTAPTDNTTTVQPVAPVDTPQPETVQQVDTAPAPLAPVVVSDKPVNKTQLAKLVGVSRTTITNWVNDGKLDTEIAKRLPQLEPVHTNGFNHNNGD